MSKQYTGASGFAFRFTKEWSTLDPREIESWNEKNRTFGKFSRDKVFYHEIADKGLMLSEDGAAAAGLYAFKESPADLGRPPD
eukprot:gene4680-13007_t